MDAVPPKKEEEGLEEAHLHQDGNRAKECWNHPLPR